MQVMVKVEIPDGWELAYDEMRLPLKGEMFITSNGSLAECASDYEGGEVRVIVRPAWKWPEWLLSRSVVQGIDGRWWGVDGEHRNAEEAWECGRNHINLSRTTFLPPPCDDWRKSLRRNPNVSK